MKRGSEDHQVPSVRQWCRNLLRSLLVLLLPTGGCFCCSASCRLRCTGVYASVRDLCVCFLFFRLGFWLQFDFWAGSDTVDVDKPATNLEDKPAINLEDDEARVDLSGA